MKYFVTSKISKNIRKTPEGFLVCIGVPIARTGVQEYTDGETPIEAGDDGLVQIHREEKEVFRPETLASFEGKPFTIGHPDELVNPENWSRLAHGVIQNVRRGEGEFNDSMIADILVTSAEGIRKIEQDVREVSCGYDAEYVQTGIGRGKQINIIGNHLALVEEGRAGADYAIKDHKGVKVGLKEQLKKMFPKAKDAELKTVLDAAAKIKTEDEVGMEVISDEAPAWADALMKSCQDVMASISGMGKSADADPKDEPKKEEPKAKDAGGDLEARIAKLEAAIAKLGKGADEEIAEDEDKVDDEAEETDDEETEETDDEESDDADEEGEESSMVGDEKAKVEILAPGLKPKGKDFKAQALKAACKTKDGKEVIDILSGNKALDYKNSKRVSMVFDAAVEVLKVKRAKSFSKTRQGATVKDGHSDNNGAPMTAEKLNEINQKHYAAQQGRH